MSGCLTVVQLLHDLSSELLATTQWSLLLVSPETVVMPSLRCKLFHCAQCIFVASLYGAMDDQGGLIS